MYKCVGPVKETGSQLLCVRAVGARSHPSTFSPFRENPFKIVLAEVGACPFAEELTGGEVQVCRDEATPGPFPCRGAEPRAEATGRRARSSLLGVLIKRRAGSPRKCLKWLEPFLPIWKWMSAVIPAQPPNPSLPGAAWLPMRRLRAARTGSSHGSHGSNARAVRGRGSGCLRRRQSVMSPSQRLAWEGAIKIRQGPVLVYEQRNGFKRGFREPGNKAQLNPANDLNWLQTRPLTAFPVRINK